MTGIAVATLLAGLTLGGEGQVPKEKGRPGEIETLQAQVRELRLLLLSHREEQKRQWNELQAQIKELSRPRPQKGPDLKEAAFLLDRVRMVQEENESLRGKLKEAENETFRLRAQEEAVRARMIRMENDLRRLTALLASQAPNPPRGLPGQANPPPQKMSGKVVEVAKDLVRIDLGKDNGLEKGQTLEVFRLEPRPMYLGRIRIVQVENRQALAQREGAFAQKIQAGDRVTSRLDP